ncbi:MAG: hypothetical protein ACYC64_03885 [Armatimonadota bacterium]
MDQHSRSELIASYRKRYRKSSKREKSQIISAIIDATGYCRKYVIRALNTDVRVTLVPTARGRRHFSTYSTWWKGSCRGEDADRRRYNATNRSDCQGVREFWLA